MNRTVAIAICLAVFANAVHAAEYPARPVRLVVPFPPGGTSDILTRIIADKLGAGLGQQAVIDNRPGAGGVVASEIVAKATPDGYTVLMTFISHAINPHVYLKLPYDTGKDFTPIALFAITPNVVVVTPSLPVKSVKDLIAYAKAQPGKVNYGSAGIGTNSHLSGEMINAMAGIKMVHIAYKGAPQANADVANGTIQLHIPSMPVAMPLIQAGRLRAIAVTSARRSPALPDAPTVAETLPGYESLAWYGFTAPSGTPQAAVNRLSTEVEKALKAPELIDSFSRQGADATYMNPREFGDYLRSEHKRWGETVKASGLKPGSL
jgi:tripartite-type tricarboxylate transporter receptor subunit TctC